MVDQDRYSELKKNSKKLFLYSEGIFYSVQITLVFVLIVFIIDLAFRSALTLIGIGVGVIIFGSIPAIAFYTRYLGPVMHYAKANVAETSDKRQTTLAIKRFYFFPVIHLSSVVLRGLVLFASILIYVNLTTNPTHIQKLNLWSLLFINILVSGLAYYFIADVFIGKIAVTEMFPANLEGKSRISSPLALMTISTTAVGIVIMALVVFNIFYRTVKKSYLNQMHNISQIVESQMEKFYHERIGDAKVLLANPLLIRSIRTGRYEEVTKLFKSVYNEYGIYENVFITTAEKNSRIVASPVKGSLGIRARNFGYAKNIDIPMTTGKFYFSEAKKSPVTGLPVVLLTAPIKDGNAVIGILGLPFELGKFANEMIAKTRIGYTGYVFMLDNKLKFLAHPKKEEILKEAGQYDFGKRMKTLPSGSVVSYLWHGEHKLLSFIKNKHYGYYAVATILLSDINRDLINAEIALLVIILGSLSFIGLVMTMYIQRKLRSLYNNEKLIERLSQGDLSQDPVVTSNDEIGRIGQRLKKFIEELRNSMRNIQDIAGEVASSSQEMSGASVTFADNAQSQAAAAEEVTATMEEVSASVDNVAENSADQFTKLSSFIDQMQKLSESINEMADKLRDTIHISDNISSSAKSGEESLHKMTTSMGKIIDSSQEMSNIVGMINKISEQINLLSLNAAIEAARAGEAGKGFAVVADEISKLADQTAASIKDINQFITSNNEEINLGKANITATIDTMSTVIHEVNNISEMMKALSGFMDKQLDSNATINRDSVSMKNKSDEMKAATEEQKLAVTEIVKSVSSINELTQANASGAEQIAGTSQGLAGMAETLQEAVNYFQLQKS